VTHVGLNQAQCSQSLFSLLLVLAKISMHFKYRKVASRSMSWLEACPRIFRLYMKGKFDPYVLWPLTKRVQNWIVNQSACNFTVWRIINKSPRFTNSNRFFCNAAELKKRQILLCWITIRKLTSIYHENRQSEKPACASKQDLCSAPNFKVCSFIPQRSEGHFWFIFKNDF
jgi:hypothetical protein